jgi:hypothetical protein
MLVGALNEVCNGVHIQDWEFQTRLGRTRPLMRQLLDEVASVKLGRRP